MAERAHAAQAPLLDQLAEAAARGVAVTIDRAPAALRLRWAFEEKWWGEIGTTRAAGFHLHVIDRDGDSSAWSLARAGEVLARGDDWGYEPHYHFDACLLAAEAALFAEVTRRKASLNRARDDAGEAG